MQNPFKEKMIEKKEQADVKPRKLELLSDLEHVEIKKLGQEEVKPIYLVMKKTLWEVGEAQVADVVKSGLSYGAYVERMPVGAGLAWPAFYDEARQSVGEGEPNAIYLEDVALLLAYEGKGIRDMLVAEREKAAKAKGFAYAIAFISPDWKPGDLREMIRERGNKAERAYLAMGYSFVRGRDGILAVKKLG